MESLNNQIQDGALYIRVSTDRQEELSPDAQKRLLLDYAREHDIFISPDYIFMDNGISGRKADKRPEFQRMIALAKSPDRPFSVILVWKFSRFARNQEESIVYKSMLKKQCQIDVVSITEPLAEGPFSSLIERIIEWMDEYYSINLAEEVKRGMTEKAMRGGYQITPPLGYKSPGYNQPFEVVPDEAKIIQYIFDQYASGNMNTTKIARELNRQGYKTRRGNNFEERNITRTLKNRFYIGKLIWNGIERDGQHETFISNELFQEANERLNASHSSSVYSAPSRQPHWLTGLVKCSICGSNLSYSVPKRSRSGGPFFQCWRYAKGQHSGSNHISEKDLVSAVYSYFERILNGESFEFAYRSSANHPVPDDTSLYKKEMETLNKREKRIHEAYEAGIDTIDEYRQNKERIQNERAQLIEKINSLKPSQKKNNAEDREKLIKTIQNVYDVITDDSAGNELKGTFIRSVLDKIIWNRAENSLAFFISFDDEHS